MIAAFTDACATAGCHPIFLGALATERPKYLYARLGFRPVMLARAWVRELRRVIRLRGPKCLLGNP